MKLAKDTLYCSFCRKDHKITTSSKDVKEHYRNGKVVAHWVNCWAYCPAQQEETILGAVEVLS